MFDTGSYFSLEGQTAIVTGGTTGLGLAITRCMVGAGAKVAVLSYESREQGREALKEFGGKAVFYQFDITDTDHTQEMADRVIAEQGPVTILVNNAGNHCKKYIEDMTVEDYVNVLNVHLVGAFALTKALFPHMKEQGKGSILFQASMTTAFLVPGEQAQLHRPAAGGRLCHGQGRLSGPGAYPGSRRRSLRGARQRHCAGMD